MADNDAGRAERAERLLRHKLDLHLADMNGKDMDGITVQMATVLLDISQRLIAIEVAINTPAKKRINRNPVELLKIISGSSEGLLAAFVALSALFTQFSVIILEWRVQLGIPAHIAPVIAIIAFLVLLFTLNFLLNIINNGE